ncbi:hypothetical protein CDO44_04690 [Pigmentiphaga sp. NML080357]|uniref:hypothetical protein n=1 Tax=Pigmentiphaga sp. NML080357 TaxID=2008675 RepID=UPI000B40BF7A|nr:hypothetical protein [Pigmentiphaga sp. NML080357]OVZ62154.1 hypothetical protein CDO44_04690 [Pigmentiphaga sp. NML080357]
MNKVFDSTRSTGPSAAIMLGGLVVMITVLAAGAAIGQVRDPRAARADAGRRVSGNMVSQVENAVTEAAGAQAGASTVEGPSGVMRASMGSWAGPVSPDERRQVPRRLSSEERLLLRQEIRRASEEVYEPYRKHKH